MTPHGHLPSASSPEPRFSDAREQFLSIGIAPKEVIKPCCQRKLRNFEFTMMLDLGVLEPNADEHLILCYVASSYCFHGPPCPLTNNGRGVSRALVFGFG